MWSFVNDIWTRSSTTILDLFGNADFLKASGGISMFLLWVWSTKENEMPHVKNVFRKGMFWATSICYMVLSKDTKGLGKKYQTPESDPIHLQKKGFEKATVKRLIFIRHGESDWNFIFNKGLNFRMFLRICKAWILEFSMFFRLDSPYLDSPLNDDGIQQAVELRKFIEDERLSESSSDTTKEILSIIRGETGKSMIVSSTLRRAISTTSLALWPRIQRTGEKIHLLSYAQEISRNVDTCALSAARQMPDLPFSRISEHCEDISDAAYNTSLNTGNKGLKQNGKSRIEAFNKWLFEITEETVIVGGHSLWFQHFFNLYLPYESEFRGKIDKMKNSGMLSFNIYKCNETKALCIDESSMQIIHPSDGFEEPKKKTGNAKNKSS